MFCIIFKTKAQEMLLRTIYEKIQMNRIVNLKGNIGQSAMRAQVATFAGWPRLSQF
jgi:hypothetical protein